MNLIDLFCGCGGFSLGAQRAGFQVSLGVDLDAQLTRSRKVNFPTTKLKLGDVTQLTAEDIAGELDRNSVFGLIGGPPCQGFSTIGKRDASDPRRELVYQFFRLVAELRPLFFVMENVPGLALEGSRHLLEESLDLVAASYDFCGPVVLNAVDYGAPTNRRRLFVIGTLRDHVDPLSQAELLSARKPEVNVRAAIKDLDHSRFLREEDGFDVWRLDGRFRSSSYAQSMRASDLSFTGNQRTMHRAEVALRFSRVPPGKSDSVGKHFRLSWDGVCPTLRAGTGSDRGAFQSVRPIHPEEPRVITVREAARLQGFPDWFRFHPTVWHSFRMIGNSVSPIQAEVIFKLLKEKMPSQ